MSLRVLLADESPSIKKAFDLALKDFAVTVQTVHQGTDVLALFNSFQPDICFLDVFLPKRNGYEACMDIKQNGQLQSPVILMWSNFMEVDQSKFTACGAEAKIEKPFETKTLREIVISHVPKVKGNRLSEFLEPEAQAPEPGPQNNSQASPDVASLKEAPLEAAENDDSGVALPDLPDIDSILDNASDDSDDHSDGADDEISPIDDFDPTGGSDMDSSPSDSNDDPFGSLDLQEDDDADDENDLENFQMEPLESFGPNDEQDSSDNTPSALDLKEVSDQVPPLDPLDSSAFGGDPVDSSNDSSTAHSSFGEEDDTDPSVSVAATEAEEPPPLDSDFSSEAPPLDHQSFSSNNGDADDTDPSVVTGAPPLPNEDSNRDFSGTDDEITDPSISIADNPIISPPPPPAFEAQNEIPPLPGSEESEPSPSEMHTDEAPSSNKVESDLDKQLSKEELKRLVMAQSKDIIESVVWEVVPELAKEMIKKEIERLTGELNPNEEAL